MSEFRNDWEGTFGKVSELERNLQAALNVLNQAVSKRTATKQTAVRWFNRLYYDLSCWNAEFITFLNTYPGFRTAYTEEEYQAFKEEFSRLADKLDSRNYYSRGDGYDLESDICLRINFLSARLRNDFKWLEQEDPDAYTELSFAVGYVIYYPNIPSELGVSSALYRAVESLGCKIFGDEKRAKNRNSLNTSNVKEAIENYIEKSNEALNRIGEEARRIGFLLLSVTEYAEALKKEGSANPNLYVIGEVTVATEGDTYNIGQAGAAGRDARSDHNTFVQSEEKKTLTEAAAEIKQLLRQLEQTNPTATETEKIAYVNDETTPSFKRRVVGALKTSGETAVDEFILENKYLKVVKAAIKGWLQPDS
jgi:hypothetical protein